MKIIVEGCDGTGKTSLVKRLAAEHNLDICHVSNRDSNTFEFYRQLIIGKEDIIYDRNVIGEMIYPQIFKRKGNLDEIDFKYLIERAKKDDVKIIVLTATNEEIRRRLSARGEPHQCVLDNIEIINAAFCTIAMRRSLVLIDTTNKSFDEIFEEANGYVTRKSIFNKGESVS